MKKLYPTYAITFDRHRLTHSEQVALFCSENIKLIQVRCKTKPDKKDLDKCRSTANKNNCTIILNDFVDLSKELMFDGVHLGANDMSPISARKILGSSYIIGKTINSKKDIAQKELAECNYVGIGPIRETNTKVSANKPLGKHQAAKLLSQTKLPAYAIGGMKRDDLKEFRESGFFGIALSSSLLPS